jgi:hypothetical protein
MSDLRDEILAATIDAITKSEHVYVTTDKILSIVARALLEHGEAIADAIKTEEDEFYTTDFSRGYLAGLVEAADIARAHGRTYGEGN